MCMKDARIFYGPYGSKRPFQTVSRLQDGCTCIWEHSFPRDCHLYLRKYVEGADLDVKDFVNDNIYVDDGIFLCEIEEQEIRLIKRMQRALYDEGCLRLHNTASNDKAVSE